MARAKVVRDEQGRVYAIRYRCPCGVCGNTVLPVDWAPPGEARATHAGGPRWGFNGDLERPTFTPSVLTRSGHYAGAHGHGGGCWCTWEREEGAPPPFACGVCHSFVRHGQVQFLADCTHAMAGQTVDLPAIE